MFNLNNIIQAAQGGQGISNLAQQFGLSPDQAQAAINAILPGLSAGLQNKAGDAGGLGSIIGSLTQGTHQATYQDANAAKTPQAAAAGTDILGQLFGSSHITPQIAQAAAGQSGLRPDILAQMMPIVASMVMGGLFTSMQKQGMGGLLGQLQNAAGSGGLGTILGQVLGGQAGAAQAPAAGGFGGMLSSIFGSLLGGGAAKTPQLPGGLSGEAVQAGIDALGKMMQPGMQVAAGHQQIIQDVLAQMMKNTGK